MRPNLAIDQLEPPLRLGDLLAQTRRQLGQQIAMLASRSLRVPMQFAQLARAQGLFFRIEIGDIALCMLNLPG
jgi:hypothetical protein